MLVRIGMQIVVPWELLVTTLVPTLVIAGFLCLGIGYCWGVKRGQRYVRELVVEFNERVNAPILLGAALASKPSIEGSNPSRGAILGMEEWIPLPDLRVCSSVVER